MLPDVNDMLRQGSHSFRNRDFDTAEKIYRRILVVYPNHPDALHNLGLIAVSTNCIDDALNFFELAIKISPQIDQYWISLIDILIIQRKLKEATSVLKKATKSGVDKVTLKQLKNMIKKQAHNIRVSTESADGAPQRYSMDAIITAFHAKKYEIALPLTLEILKDNPINAEGWKILTAIYIQTQKFDDALSAGRNSIKFDPSDEHSYYNMGSILLRLGDFAASENAFKTSINLAPEFPNSYFGLGNLQVRQEKFEDAINSYRSCIRLDGKHWQCHLNLGITLLGLNLLSEALDALTKATNIEPDCAKTLGNIGAVLNRLDRFSEAEYYLRKAVLSDPQYSNAYYNLGATLQRLGKLENSLASFKSAMCIQPNIEYGLGGLLHVKMHLCDWSMLDEETRNLAQRIMNSERASSPFPLHALIDDPELHKRSSEIYALDKFASLPNAPFIKTKRTSDKIRIGYFSADFRNHPVAYLTAGLYEIHDRSIFEIHAFSLGRDTTDEFNARIKKGVDHFHNMENLGESDIVDLARSLDLDIGVDLSGYTEGSKPAVFAMRIAPVQISYIGFLGTMGTPYYDYLIADSTLVPPHNRNHYSESIAYLPSYQVNLPLAELKSSDVSRQEYGLLDGSVIFCCFNNSYKYTPDTMDCWSEILKAVDESSMILYVDNKTTENNIKKEFFERGINPERIIFSGLLNRDEYLRRYYATDIFLDTFPYNAGATASDALRAGVPVITKMGQSFPSRIAGSLLTVLGLEELIAGTNEEYIALAINLAKHPKKLGMLKNRVNECIQVGPLFDTQAFVDSLENAYSIMHDRATMGLLAEDIIVK